MRKRSLTPKKRKLEAIDDSWWVDLILTTMSKPARQGGGYLFDHGLFVFLKLKTVKVPRRIIIKMINAKLIKRVAEHKHHSYKLVRKRRQL